MEGMNTTTNWIIAGIVALIIIIGGGWLVAQQRAGSMSGGVTSTTTNETGTSSSSVTTGSDSSMSSSTMMPTPSAMASGETVSVLDQPAGMNVIVANVTLSKPSWVAVRDTNDWILGAAWFNESVPSVVVPLLRATVKGQTYQAVIYADDGDKKFSLHAGDTLLTDVGGAPVSSTFKAQ